MRVRLALLLLMAFTTSAHAAAKVLVFDMEILDTSGEPPNPDHPGRLERMTEILSDGLKGRYEVMGVRDTALAAEVPASIRLCNGCERDLGRKAGADIVATGYIHKISTLILNVQIIMRNVGSGEIVAMGLADIRGDNERSWQHGVDWLLRHRLLTNAP